MTNGESLPPFCPALSSRCSPRSVWRRIGNARATTRRSAPVNRSRLMLAGADPHCIKLTGEVHLRPEVLGKSGFWAGRLCALRYVSQAATGLPHLETPTRLACCQPDAPLCPVSYCVGARGAILTMDRVVCRWIWDLFRNNSWAREKLLFAPRDIPVFVQERQQLVLAAFASLDSSSVYTSVYCPVFFALNGG
jgi:hypothetical protein